jgi:acyl-homoserine lactone acylase PvdQ
VIELFEKDRFTPEDMLTIQRDHEALFLGRWRRLLLEVLAYGDEENGLMHMPTGQSGHPMSPFYRSAYEDCVSGAPSPFLPGPTRHQLTLKPAR